MTLRICHVHLHVSSIFMFVCTFHFHMFIKCSVIFPYFYGLGSMKLGMLLKYVELKSYWIRCISLLKHLETVSISNMQGKHSTHDFQEGMAPHRHWHLLVIFLVIERKVFHWNCNLSAYSDHSFQMLPACFQHALGCREEYTSGIFKRPV